MPVKLKRQNRIKEILNDRLISNQEELSKKLKEEGIGKLALVYIICLFGFIIWVGLLISWIFFHGITPPIIQ